MTKDEFKKEYPEDRALAVAEASGQWLGNGVPVKATIWETEHGYYLEWGICFEEDLRGFFRKQGASEEPVDEAKNYCEQFGVKSIGPDPEEAVKKANAYLEIDIGKDGRFYYKDGEIEGE